MIQNVCIVYVKDRDLHSQKYHYDNFICMFSWLANFFTRRNLIKIKAQSLKSAWAGTNTCVSTNLGFDCIFYSSAQFVDIISNDLERKSVFILFFRNQGKKCFSYNAPFLDLLIRVCKTDCYTNQYFNLCHYFFLIGSVTRLGALEHFQLKIKTVNHYIECCV